MNNVEDLPWNDLAEIIVQVGFATTKSEARRAIKQGAVRLNDTFKITDQFAKCIATVQGLHILQDGEVTLLEWVT